MLYRGRLFLAVILLAVGVFTHPSGAVPTVNKFSSPVNNNIHNNILTSKTTPIKSSTVGTLSVSGSGLNSVNKTDTKTTNGVNVLSSTPTLEDSVDSVRIPGLHSNFIKSIGAKLSSNYTQQPSNNVGTADLTQRIIDLEEDIAKKQEMLESGNGISIDGKTISLSQEIVTLPERLDEIDQEINSLNKKIESPGNPENYYTIGETQEYVQQAVSNIPGNETIYDSVAQEYKRITIVNEFSAKDFIDKQQESEQ